MLKYNTVQRLDHKQGTAIQNLPCIKKDDFFFVVRTDFGTANSLLKVKA